MRIIKLLLLLLFAQSSNAQINKNDHFISGYFTYWNQVDTGTINQHLRHFETNFQYSYFPLQKFYISGQIGFIPYFKQEYSNETRINSGSPIFPIGVSLGYYQNFENNLTLIIDLLFRYEKYTRKSTTIGLNGIVNGDFKYNYYDYHGLLSISLNYFLCERFAINGTIQLIRYSKYYGKTKEINSYGTFEYDYTSKSISINSIFGIPQLGVFFRLNKND